MTGEVREPVTRRKVQLSPYYSTYPPVYFRKSLLLCSVRSYVCTCIHVSAWHRYRLLSGAQFRELLPPNQRVCGRRPVSARAIAGNGKRNSHWRQGRRGKRVVEYSTLPGTQPDFRTSPGMPHLLGIPKPSDDKNDCTITPHLPHPLAWYYYWFDREA